MYTKPLNNPGLDDNNFNIYNILAFAFVGAKFISRADELRASRQYNHYRSQSFAQM